MSDFFRYRDWHIEADNQTVVFTFETFQAGEQFTFSEKIVFPERLVQTRDLEKALSALHLGLGISYYKLFVPRDIEHPYRMSAEAASFWNSIFTKGLAEFLYINDLTADQIASFKEQPGAISTLSASDQSLKKRVLLGIGGGKDSIVAGELLQRGGMGVHGFCLATGGNTGQAAHVASIMKVPLHAAQRTIDPLLLELNKRGDTFNGHVPISLIFALVGSVIAVNSNFQYVVVANESSASLPQVGDVNHQWSKSLEFELLFQRFAREQICEQLSYCSVIRPYSSVVVAKLFSNFSDYFTAFTSDNSIFKIDQSGRSTGRWGLDSSKTLSSFMLLSTWLDEPTLQTMFEHDLANQPTLLPLARRLLGLEGTPPLDCVGTPLELQISLANAFSAGKFEASVLRNELTEPLNQAVPSPHEQLRQKVAERSEHAMPDELLAVINREVEKLL